MMVTDVAAADTPLITGARLPACAGGTIYCTQLLYRLIVLT